MKVRAVLVVAALVVAGCSSSDDTPARPATCDPETERVGTYMATYTEQSGDCGAVEPGLITLAPGGNAGDGCVLDYENVSEGGCKIERSIRCRQEVRDAASWGGYAVVDTTVVAVTRQVTEDGSRIEGTMTFTYDDGRDPCRSTYGFVAVRQ